MKQLKSHCQRAANEVRATTHAKYVVTPVDAKRSAAADFSTSDHLDTTSLPSISPHSFSSTAIMAPNRVVVSNNARPQKGFMSTIYDEATSPENTTIVRSLLVFGVRLCLLSNARS
jgi:hypothetical protein